MDKDPQEEESLEFLRGQSEMGMMAENNIGDMVRSHIVTGMQATLWTSGFMIFIMKPLNDFNNGDDDLEQIGGSRVNEQREIATVIQVREDGT